jgi:hypothetical protein
VQTRYAVWLIALLWLTSHSISVEAQQRREEIKPPIQPPVGMPSQGQSPTSPPMERPLRVDDDRRKQGKPEPTPPIEKPKPEKKKSQKKPAKKGEGKKAPKEARQRSEEGDPIIERRK